MAAVDEYGLYPLQRRWCDLYLQYGDATKAAREAGYSEKGANQTGSRLLANAHCADYIANRMKRATARRIADADEVLDFFSRTMRGEIKDQFGLDASLADRIKAAQELMRRYAVADDRQRGTLQRLDAILLDFRAALDAPPASDAMQATGGAIGQLQGTQGGEGAQGA